MSDHPEFLKVARERIQSALDEQRLPDALAILLDLHPVDQAELFNLLDEEAQAYLFSQLDAPATADLLEELEDDEVLEAVEALTTQQLADVLDEMEPDEAADLLGDLPAGQVSEILAQMEDADEVVPLLGYPDETAGGLMTTWFIALRRHTTAEQAIRFLRQVSPDMDVPYYLYVVDREKRLIGIVGLRELVVSAPGSLMEAIMEPEVIYVTVGMDQEEVARKMARYDLAHMPVVDDQNRLLGVITHDDLVDVLEDEATEDFLRLGAVESGPLEDRPYWSQRIYDLVRSRFVWLLVLFVAETFTGIVLRHYQTQLETVVALSFFIPLLIGTGGNAGSQTVATVIRALALQEVRPKDAMRVWWREARVGILLGILIGVAGYFRALVWGVSPEMALTVGITVAVICTWATTVAALVPIIASALRMDPTIISGPLMTTLIDGTGLIIYFSLAALILPQLR
jgi:magnesium transporter